MTRKLTTAELLALFPRESLPVAAHGRRRGRRGRHTAHTHGRSRSHREKLPVAAKRDPWKHIGQAKRQG